MKKLLFVVLFLFLPMLLLAQDLPEPVNNFLAELGAILVPVIVWLAGIAVNWLKKTITSTGGFGGTLFLTLVVPILSFASAGLYTWIAQPDMNFWVVFGLGFVGTFVNEIIRQWGQTAEGTQKKIGS